MMTWSGRPCIGRTSPISFATVARTRHQHWRARYSTQRRATPAPWYRAGALHTPLLLLLDEATSSLDAETEKDIIDTLKELEGKVTTVTVAHRLATVRLADQVLYLNDGAIIARGTFDEVRAKVADFDRQAALLGL